MTKISLKDKSIFLGKLEEIALMMNSGLIKDEVAYYNFGYWVIRCWENKAFWDTPGLNQEHKLWSLLRNFYHEMKAIDGRFVYKSNEMRF